MPPTDGPPSWEEVLAAFEASAAHAEALVSGDASEVPAAPVVGYDLWSLSLPPMPDDLRARAEAIHQRQLAATAELRTAMRSVRSQQLLAEQQLDPRRPLYVDQLA